MAQLKPGTRLRSAVCTTEVMVIAIPQGGAPITCGGVPMIELNAPLPEGASISPDAKGGTKMGKRYVNADGTLELLCTKPGEGSLGIGATLLQVKEAKPLPSSD